MRVSGQEHHIHRRQQFQSLIEGKKLVGLGESIHDSSEITQEKHRLIKQMIEEDGFRAIGFEAPWQIVECVNHALNEDDPDVLEQILEENKHALRWSTPEMKSLLSWIRAHNIHFKDQPEQHLTIFGVDIRNPYLDVAEIKEQLSSKTLPEELAAAASGLYAGISKDTVNIRAWYDLYKDPSFHTYDDHTRCVDAIDRLLTYFKSTETNGAAPQHKRFLKSLESLKATQFDAIYNYHHSPHMDFSLPNETRSQQELMIQATTHRTKAMFKMLDDVLMRHPDRKTILSMSTLHVMRDGDRASSIERSFTGRSIAEKYGDDYAVIGVSARSAKNGHIDLEQMTAGIDRIEFDHHFNEISHVLADDITRCENRFFGGYRLDSRDTMDLFIVLPRSEPVEFL